MLLTLRSLIWGVYNPPSAVYGNRVRESSTSTGAGPIVLDGAPIGFATFAERFPIATDAVAFCIEGINADGSQTGEWEVVSGTFDGTTGLTRDTVFASSNSGSLVNFSAGTKNVFSTAPAEYLQVFSSTTQGVVKASGGGTTNFLRADGEFAAPPTTAPAGSTTQIQYNNAGVFGASSLFTYDAGTNTVSFGNITGSALGMTIQPRAPTSLENPGTLLIQAQDAVKANTNGGSVRIRPGAKTGTGAEGILYLESQDNNYNLIISNNFGFYFTDQALGCSFQFQGGVFSFVGSQIAPALDTPNTFITGLNSTSTGNVPFQFLTDSQIIFEFGEPTFGTQVMAFFGVTPVAQPTTATTAATRAAVIGTVANVGDTYDGYTLAKVVKALRNLGILA
jgi:hypothetical protein